MVIEDFKTLPVPEQWDELWEYGKRITGIITSEGNYTLYSLHGFYVDVLLDPITNKVVENHPFLEGDRMEKYLKKLPIDL